MQIKIQHNYLQHNCDACITFTPTEKPALSAVHPLWPDHKQYLSYILKAQIPRLLLWRLCLGWPEVKPENLLLTFNPGDYDLTDTFGKQSLVDSHPAPLLANSELEASKHDKIL